MLAVEDYLDTLKWAESIGGLPALIARADRNLGVLANWVQRTDWVDFLARDPAPRSNTSVCLKIVDPWFTALAPDAQAVAASKIASLLEKEGVALDIGGYRAAPPGLRICAAPPSNPPISKPSRRGSIGPSRKSRTVDPDAQGSDFRQIVARRHRHLQGARRRCRCEDRPFQG
jgi:hypothetical protein